MYLKRAISGIATISVSIVMVAVIVLGAVAQTGNNPVVLVVSQPDLIPSDRYFDLSPHLDGPIREAGKFDPVLYSRNSTSVADALRTAKLKSSDVTSNPSREVVHKVAQAVGATYVVILSTDNLKDSLTTQMTLDYLLAPNTWTTVATDRLSTMKATTGKNAGVLAAIHMQVDEIVKRLSAKSNGVLVNGNNNTISRGTPPTVEGSPPITPIGKPANLGSKTPSPDPGKRASDPPVTPKSNSGVNLPKNPNAASVYELLVDRARRNGDVAGLILSLRKAVTEKPEDAALRRELIMAYRERGWTDVSRQEAQRAVEIIPNDGSLHRLLGEGYADVMQMDDAMAEFKEAIRIDPKDPLNHVSLGDLYLRNGRTKEAEAEFAVAANSEIKNPVVFRRIAGMELVRGNYKSSNAALQSAINLTPVDDRANLEPEFASMFQVIESTLTEISNRIQIVRGNFTTTNINREKAYQEYTAIRKRAEDIAGCLDEMPVPTPGMNRIKSYYGQSASLMMQSADKLLEGLESQKSVVDEEALLLRREAVKQLNDAGRRLKALLDARK
ncbi:MAG: tetratricopeptide repeat protein [Chthonomonadales bacterium]